MVDRAVQAPHSTPVAHGSGRRLRWLALAAVISTYVLIVIGGVVRVTGSGLGCPDWPLCHGRVIPPPDPQAWIEYIHRLAASVTSPLILLTAAVAYLRHRQERWLVRPAILASVLLVVQVLLGALAVLRELPPTVVAAHLGNSLLILGLVLTVAVLAFRSLRGSVAITWRWDPLSRLGALALAALFLLLLSGAWVTGSGALAACAGWPLCDGRLWPGNTLGQIHMLHRFVAAAVGVLVAVLAWRAYRARVARPATFVAAVLALTLFLAQVTIGALMLLRGFTALLRGLHLATASATWAGVVVTALLAGTEVEGRGQVAGGGRARWKDYLVLTKPLILVLLLVTTLSAMLVAARGWPGWSKVLWTLLGGALSAGGAAALNQYVDRELDRRMRRTWVRPLPRGRLRPAEVLAFGLVLCLAGFYVLALAVNLLSAILALAGMIYYIPVYSLFLKPRTPHNIVIGGGAGAVPPLVGWAAATGGLDMAAFFLFALIFFWTPPHFWALALVRRKDFARAGIPMLPVVRGEAQTRRLIFLYTVQVVALTLLMPLVEVGGALFLPVALLLGGGLIIYAWRLWRDGGERLAWQMYRYSSLYLALIFGAMVAGTVIER